MTCDFPLTAWRSPAGPVFNKTKAYQPPQPIKLPCGQCIGCRLDRSRQWAIRCVHEAQLHPKNSFITLTYAPEHLPDPPTLRLDHFQKFMKRLRKKVGSVRFYHCGEYGEQYRRPHYHACLFGYDFPDKVLWKNSNGIPLYTSKLLESLWPFGYSTIGDVTFESAAYVARYIMKKVNGEARETLNTHTFTRPTGERVNVDLTHYQLFNPITGEVHDLSPEYTTMSRRPGIGSEWLNNFTSDVYPSDEVILRGKKLRPPKFYERLFEAKFPSDMFKIKIKRQLLARLHLDDQTESRLNVRHEVQKARLRKLPRTL